MNWRFIQKQGSQLEAINIRQGLMLSWKQPGSDAYNRVAGFNPTCNLKA
jgi:hypothetical protein